MSAKLDEMTEPYIESLCATNVREGIDLDYKDGAIFSDPSRVKKITKSISAFANAIGGTLLFGVAENGAEHYVKGIDPHEVRPEHLTEIAKHLQPRLDVDCKTIHLQSHPGKVIYALYIPPGIPGSVYQATDQVHYRRYDDKCLPMLNYEILEKLAVVGVPKLSIRTIPQFRNAVDFIRLGSDGKGHYQPFEIRPIIINDSAVAVEYALFHYLLDVRLLPDRGANGFRPGVSELKTGGESYDVVVGEFSFKPPSMPVFRGVPKPLMDCL